MFKAQTVTSAAAFSRQEGRRMAGALAEALGHPPGAMWLFCSPKEGVEELLEGISELAPNQPVIGCTTDGEISSSGFHTGSAVLGGVATDKIEFHTASVEELSFGSEQAGRELARKLPDSLKYVQLFSDGLTANGCAILRGMRSVLGDEIPICGGAAADGQRFRHTSQFLGKRVLTDSLVAIGYCGDFRISTGVRSGWSPIGIPKRVTRASGNILYELDGRPALEVYRQFLGKHAEKLPAVGVEYPLCIMEKSDLFQNSDYRMLLRATMSVDHDRGSISFAGEIPEGAMVRLTCGDHNCILDATRRATRLAVEGLEGREPALAFFISCMARKIVLGRRTGEEVERVSRELGAHVPVLGFYSYGEFCPTRRGGPSLLHNETATLSIIGF